MMKYQVEVHQEMPRFNFDFLDVCIYKPVMHTSFIKKLQPDI